MTAARDPVGPSHPGPPPAEVAPTFEAPPSSEARIQHTLPLVVAGIVASMANLLSTVFLSRLLSSADYGALIQLLGLFLVLSMPGTAVMVGVVRRVTSWEVRGQGHHVRDWVHRVHRIGVAAVVVLALAIWLARGPLIGALALPTSTGVVEILTAGGVWVLVSIDRGLLQARQAYRALAANLVIEGTVRAVVMIGLTAAGMGLEGAALGLLVAEVAAAGHARWMVRRTLPARHQLPGDQVVTVGVDGAVAVHTGRDLAADIVTAVASLALLAILQNADVILLGSRAPLDKGSYAAISVPSKALVFWALTFANYLLPEATIRFHQGKHALRQLGHTFVVLAAPAASLLLVALVAPHWALSLVFKEANAGGAPAFAPLAGAMIFLSVSVVLTSYLMGVGWRWVVPLLATGTAFLIVLTVRADGRMQATADADLLVQGSLAVVMVVAFLLMHRRAGLER